MLYATHAEVHLGNIRANLRAIRDRVGTAKILIAVKADAYGHGAVAVSRMAEQTGAADWLGVATVPEGIELRQAGVGLPILKFTPCFPEELTAALAARLTLAVADEATARAASAAGAAEGRDFDVHLKIDTGMHRVGAEPEQAVALARLVEGLPGVRLEGAFTHFAASDVPSGDAFTATQLARFHRSVQAIEAELRRPLAHVHSANSGAVLGHSEATGTMVRPGIMAYGHYPDPTTPRTIELLPGLSLKSRVTVVKTVRAGDSVGYGRTYVAPFDTTIATVPAGYADGFSRLNSNRGEMLVNGRRYPVAGRVCMDQTMLDLGPGPTDVTVGDEVVMIGTSGSETISATEVADLMGTIPYEVTSLIPARVTRVYQD